MDPETWEADWQHRSNWRNSVKRGVKEYDTCRIMEAEQKRQLRKSRTSSSSSPSQPSTITCPHCNRSFRARIGLITIISVISAFASHREVMVIFASEGRTSSSPMHYQHFFLACGRPIWVQKWPIKITVTGSSDPYTFVFIKWILLILYWTRWKAVQCCEISWNSVYRNTSGEEQGYWFQFTHTCRWSCIISINNMCVFTQYILFSVTIIIKHN